MDWPKLYVVDVEGNGARPPDLVEVATLPADATGLHADSAREWLIRPPRPVTWHATRVHGLTAEDLSDCPPWEEVADQVQDVLGGAWICAHNAHVEHRVLTAHLPQWQPAGVLDTLRLAKTTRPGLPSYSLDALIEHFQLDLSAAPRQRHRALYDAFAAGRLLLALAADYETWPALAAAAVPPGLPGAPNPDTDTEEPTLW
ncbi:3'-5' exonuclease [Streptomyces xinghaiensis]|uniref:3'-5' exonuclease n=1 Tax=Streptomyces xinghaiensis TaxID=1038928 RepID=UPI00031E991F|nr:3'-5' exonuclease [Streptomyces xinghaiensis]MZE75792.1 3'-5' exonuclease [Streptomyces sp. SID5475]